MHKPSITIWSLALILSLATLAGMQPPACVAAKRSLSKADRTALALIRTQAKTNFSTGVMPFWTRYTEDKQYGGLLLGVDNTGHPVADKGKYLVLYPRVIWSLAAAHEFGMRDHDYLGLAKRSIAFMTTKMWDKEYGGFYEAVGQDGTPTNDSKHVYCEEFMLYALSKYYQVSHDANAKVWAERLFDVLYSKAHDAKLGGYREDFDRTWTNLLPYSYGVGGVPSCKTVNTHMHMMEGLTALVLADPQPRFRKALAEVTDLLMTKSVQPDGTATEPLTMDWKPRPDGEGRMSVYYGHDVELAWMLPDAYHALGRPDGPAKKAALMLIDQSLRDGFDNVNGGIGRIGPRQGKLFDDPRYVNDRRVKEWWEQAECLTALVRAYHWTGNRKYLVAFEKEWDWTYKHQINHANGTWYNDVDWADGANPRGNGDTYHDGRALINVVREIDAILGK